MLFSESHQECNICKKSCLEMASVGIETLLKAILEPDRSSAFKDHFTQQKRSVPHSKNQNRTILRNTLKTKRKSTFL